MAQITVTGTADQLRRLAQQIESAAGEAVDPKSVSITIDNGIANAAAGVTGPGGKRKDA